MTDQQWKDKLISAIQGKSGHELLQAKKEVFQEFANVHPDDYAWKNGDRKKPTGSDYIANKIISDMNRIFGELYDQAIGNECARIAASMYY